MLQSPFFLLMLVVPSLTTVGSFDCKIYGPMANLYKATDKEKTLITNDTDIDVNKTSYFIIHGWKEDSNQEQYPEISRDLYLTDQGNVILVDYTEFAKEFYGTCAYSIVNSVGAFVSRIILNYIEMGLMHSSRIHLIGHSIGAHIAGYIGRTIEGKTDMRIYRISALDPAGPLFAILVFRIPFLGLSAGDAVIVDVIHSSITFGMLAPIGTVDFYVRGFLGLPMLSPACGLFSKIYCSHGLSKFLFRESIRSCGIVAIYWLEWSNELIYGYHMPKNASGIYRMYINGNSPYGRGNQTCKIH